MKVLIINKFLHPNGGSETYIFRLGEQLTQMGHEVSYFGMDHPDRVVGNAAESYTARVDFHTGKLARLLYPFKILYSREARVKLRKVLEAERPDVIHLNNFNFQLTPSILYEIRSYRKKNKVALPIVYTAHDLQLVCPNHLMLNGKSGKVCERCLGGKYYHCLQDRCIHGSRLKSLLGAMEGYLYKMLGSYRMLDVVIAPSEFLASKLRTSKALSDHILVFRNFVDHQSCAAMQSPRKDYVLYFGRYSYEKGIATLLEVCKQLPHIPFVFAGSGPLDAEVSALANVDNRGFVRGNTLSELIYHARFSVMPSECNENCPFAVMESQMCATPVLGANIGGIPELIEPGKSGELFESGNAEQLRQQIQTMWEKMEPGKGAESSYECAVTYDGLETYAEQMVNIYQEYRQEAVHHG